MPRLFRICSVVAHTIVVAWFVVADLLAVGPLPIPHAPLTFVGTLPIKLIEPPAPPPRRAGKTSPAPDASNVAPLTPPSTIAPETPRDPSPHPGRGFVEGGVPYGVDWGTITPLSVLPPPPPPPPQTPVRVTRMQLPRKLVHVDPVYPRMAQIAQVQGVVILETTIDARGRVMDARVLRSVPLLDEAALDAVRQWIYAPTLLNGVPVPIVMTMTVKFTLQPR